MNTPNEHSNKQPVDEQLLESIVHEEMSLANLLNAEALKIQAFVGKYFDFPTHPSTEEIIQFNTATSRLLRNVVVQEWLLLNKLEAVFDQQIKQFSSSIPIETDSVEEETSSESQDESESGDIDDPEKEMSEE